MALKDVTVRISGSAGVQDIFFNTTWFSDSDSIEEFAVAQTAHYFPVYSRVQIYEKETQKLVGSFYLTVGVKSRRVR